MPEYIDDPVEIEADYIDALLEVQALKIEED